MVISNESVSYSTPHAGSQLSFTVAVNVYVNPSGFEYVVSGACQLIEDFVSVLGQRQLQSGVTFHSHSSQL